MWYSAVLRFPSMHRGDIQKQGDLSRSVMDWQRFCLWSDYDANGESTTLIWRCPPYIKEKFFETYSDNGGAQLERHPMAAHVFFAEYVLLHSYDFLDFFSEPTYAWVR